MKHMPSLLQRELFGEMIRLFLLSAGALLTLLIISRAVKMRETLLGLDIGIGNMVCLFGYMVPLFMLIVIPVSCMLAVFLLYLRMGTDRELVALRAGGISIYQMIPAPMLFASACFLLTLLVSMHLIAWGMTNFRTTLLDIAASTARLELRPGVFNNDFPKLTIYARQADSDGRLRDVLVDDHSRPDRKLVLTAPSGTIVSDHADNAVRFILRHGRLYTIKGQETKVMGYKTYTVNIPIDKLIGEIKEGNASKPANMPYEKLKPERERLRAESARLLAAGDREEALSAFRRANKLELERHKRWTYPVACLILALFVIPLAASSQGVHKQVGMLIAMLMFFIYYSLMSFASVLAEEGVLPPALAMWSPNAVFLVLGIAGLRMTARERMPDVARSMRVMNRLPATAAAIVRRLRRK